MYFGWSLATLFLQGNLAYDHIEMLVWGKAWQLSYWKHPPLPAWIAEAVSLATNRAIWPQYFISPATTAIAAWVVWRAARDVAGPWRALIAALTLQGCVYYNYECDVLNHNTIQLPFVAALIWAGWRATRGSTSAWIWFGVFSAVAVYGKHTAAFAPLGVLAFTLLTAQGRQLWCTRGPYLGIVAGIIVIAPHVYGMWQIDFTPFRTAMLDHSGFETLVAAEPWWGRIAFPAEFVAAQILMLMGIWVMSFLLFFIPGEPTIEAMGESERTRAAAKYFTWCTAFPVALAALLSAAVNLHMNSLWAMAWLPYSGLSVLLWIRRPIGTSGLRTMWFAWGGQAIGTLLFVCVKMSVGAQLTGNVPNVLFDGESFSKYVGDRWSQATNGAPLRMVIGTHWIGGSICVYHPEHPDLVLDGMPLRCPWIDLSRISTEGAVLVWDGGADPVWLEKFGSHTPVEHFVIPMRTSAKVAGKELGLAIILPTAKLPATGSMWDWPRR